MTASCPRCDATPSGLRPFNNHDVNITFALKDNEQNAHPWIADQGQHRARATGERQLRDHSTTQIVKDCHTHRAYWDLPYIRAADVRWPRVRDATPLLVDCDL